MGYGEELRRWVGSRKPPRRASGLSALLRYCANALISHMSAEPHPTPRFLFASAESHGIFLRGFISASIQLYAAEAVLQTHRQFTR